MRERSRPVISCSDLSGHGPIPMISPQQTTLSQPICVSLEMTAFNAVALLWMSVMIPILELILLSLSLQLLVDFIKTCQLALAEADGEIKLLDAEFIVSQRVELPIEPITGDAHPFDV